VFPRDDLMLVTVLEEPNISVLNPYGVSARLLMTARYKRPTMS